MIFVRGYCCYFRSEFADNLKCELPRIPFAPGFWAFAKAGKRLAELHVTYERQPEFPLQHIENKQAHLDWRVEAMKVTKDRSAIIYNDWLTLSGVPEEVLHSAMRFSLSFLLTEAEVNEAARRIAAVVERIRHHEETF